jgi:N-acetylglucosamine-6-sulfatase
VVPPGFDDFHMLVSSPGYIDYDLNDNGTVTHHGNKDTNGPDTDYSTDLSRFQILDFIDKNAKTDRHRPWAVYWAPNAPHRDGGDTAMPPARYLDAEVPMTDPPNFNTGPQAQLPWLQVAQKKQRLDVPGIHREHLFAMRALKAVDEGLRAIMDRLDALGLLDRTVIVIGTDNSHNFGAYGLQDKGTAFEDALNYLLRIRFPGAPDGAERLQAVSNIDIAPFLCELAGARMPSKVDGVSFVSSLLDGSAPFREAAPLSHPSDSFNTPSFDGLRFPDRKVIVGRKGGHASGQVWMHNMIADPWELNGLPPTQEDLDKVQAMLDSF